MREKLAIIIIYLINSFLFLLRQPLSGDGLFTASLIKLPFKEMWTYIINDFHPPLYYISLSFFSRLFGFNDLVLRFFSIIFGLSTVLVFYALIKEAFSKNIAFFSSLVFVFLPNFIFTSREPRMYSLFTFLVILSFLFFNRLQQKNSFFLTTGLTVSLSLMMYTHNWGFIVIFYLLASSIITKKFKQFFLPFTISLVCYFPWLPVFINQLILKMELGRSWGLPVEKFWPRLWGAFLWNYNILLLPNIYWVVAFLASFLSILFLLLYSFRKKDLVYLNLFLPANAFMFYLLTFKESFLTFSHLSYLTPFFALGLGKGLNNFRSRNLAVIITISFTGLIFLFNIFYHYLPPSSGARSAQLYVKENLKNEALISLTPYEALRMSWYLNISPDEFIALSQKELPLFIMKDDLADNAVNKLKNLKEQQQGWVFYSGINIYRKDRASIYDPQLRIKNWLEKNSVLKIPFGENTPYPVYLYKF